MNGLHIRTVEEQQWGVYYPESSTFLAPGGSAVSSVFDADLMDLQSAKDIVAQYLDQVAIVVNIRRKATIFPYCYQ